MFLQYPQVLLQFLGVAHDAHTADPDYMAQAALQFVSPVCPWDVYLFIEFFGWETDGQLRAKVVFSLIP